jgi:hypothetical protein
MQTTLSRIVSTVGRCGFPDREMSCTCELTAHNNGKIRAAGENLGFVQGERQRYELPGLAAKDAHILMPESIIFFSLPRCVEFCGVK